MYVMGSHGRFLSKVRTDTHGKLLVEKVPLQMVQGWSKVEGGEAGELPWRGGGDWEGHTEGSEVLRCNGTEPGLCG